MIKGIGGIFWRTKNIEVLKQWYSDVLKMDMEAWNGTIIQPQPETETIFSLFKEDDDYFPTGQQVMLNFQVYDLDEVIEHLGKVGVPLEKEKEVSEFGQFTWIKDPEGRLIELWEK
ncbi:VOC family protein [Bacillus sp. KH172YL63]|uniref:VOC family protein n=1 Tax=Bacillus sp. KH172YL63 TaxID=2709784 RepID=UPI0013E45017|nr:VOC family protein [Bacillus sp. KH172YL63]BCB02703.1 glyoxalase [Bacillus sp. KH172YL63]